jgi:hypothetical protein
MVVITDIPSITLRENEHLINLIDELIAAIKGLPDDVEWGESSWAQDMEILNFIRIQTLSLQNVKDTTIRGFYRDTYHLLRMVFEAYFVLRLISTCDRYPLRIRIKRKQNDGSLEHAKSRLIQEAQKVFGNRLIKTYMEDSKTLVVLLRGIPVVDDQGRDTGVTVPYYYQAWHNFRPIEYHLRRPGLQDRIPTRRFLTGEWASIPKRISRELNKDYGLLYRYFLTFDKILDNLCLNGVLNKKTSTRVLVHYNFLSNFSHSTSDSISIVSRRTISEIGPGGLENVYNHYFSELALLYICHLLSMHLQHALYYLKWRSIRLRNRKKLYQLLCRKVEDDFGYFWFVFNQPHQYDRYTHANRKCNSAKGIHYRPEDIRLGDVRYYDDPLYRLKQLHHSQVELMTGNSFDSPFPRQDASF